MSGGVDSSVAAWLLQNDGLEVAGVTFLLGPPPPAPPEPQPPGAFPHLRASEVCSRLGVPHQVIDLRELFHARVISPFCREYAAGQTPNPCVVCNAQVKWSSLLKAADRAGCGYVATGHYARVDPTTAGFRLLRALDGCKDQSYALYRLNQQALARTLLPLGNWEKTRVRSLATQACLPTRDTPDSQDICFLPRGGLRAFLSGHVALEPGPVLDPQGRRVGTHAGLAFYTVGQRKGLGIPLGRPVYVIEKRPATNTLVVGPREALGLRSVEVRDVHWTSVSPPAPGTILTAQVELRYRSTPLTAEVHVLDGGAVRIHLPDHRQAVAPGQSAVWYQGEILLGGGFIEG